VKTPDFIKGVEKSS